MPTIVGVVGLSGSGKSSLIEEHRARGFKVYDDIGMEEDWRKNVLRVQGAFDAGRDVVVSDVLFCCSSTDVGVLRGKAPPSFPGRDEFEKRVDRPIEWIYFANDPWACAKNCLWRKMNEKPERNLDFEVGLIRLLTAVYHPPATARAVYQRS